MKNKARSQYSLSFILSLLLMTPSAFASDGREDKGPASTSKSSAMGVPGEAQAEERISTLPLSIIVARFNDKKTPLLTRLQINSPRRLLKQISEDLVNHRTSNQKEFGKDEKSKGLIYNGVFALHFYQMMADEASL